jgi:uncharacterized damage-inducible protein DinB
MDNKILIEIKKESLFRLNENRPRIENCLNRLTEEEIWKKPGPSSNSIGNLVLHLCGNITQYIISGLGKNADNRERDLEFSIEQGYSKKELLDKFQSTIEKSVKIIEDQGAESLLLKRSVQGFELSGIGIIIHVVEHCSYHTGQIAFWTKAMKDVDLGFYSGKDLNQKNTPEG